MFAVLLKDCSSEAEMHWGREEDIGDEDEGQEEGQQHMDEEVGLQELCTLSGQSGAQGWAFTCLWLIAISTPGGPPQHKCEATNFQQLCQEGAC